MYISKPLAEITSAQRLQKQAPHFTNDENEALGISGNTHINLRLLQTPGLATAQNTIIFTTGISTNN